MSTSSTLTPQDQAFYDRHLWNSMSTLVSFAIGVGLLLVIHLLSNPIIPNVIRHRKPFHVMLVCACASELALVIPQFLHIHVSVRWDMAHLRQWHHSDMDDMTDLIYQLQHPQHDTHYTTTMTWIGILSGFRVANLPFRVIAQLFRAKAVILKPFHQWFFKIGIGTSASILVTRLVIAQFNAMAPFRTMGAPIIAFDLALTIISRCIAIVSDIFFLCQYLKVRRAVGRYVHRMNQSRFEVALPEVQSTAATMSGSDGDVSEEDDDDDDDVGLEGSVDSGIQLAPSQPFLSVPSISDGRSIRSGSSTDQETSSKTHSGRRVSISSFTTVPRPLTPTYWAHRTQKQATRLNAPISLLALVILQIILEIVQTAGDSGTYACELNGDGDSDSAGAGIPGTCMLVPYLIAVSESSFMVSLYIVTCVNDKIASLAQEHARRRVKLETGILRRSVDVDTCRCVQGY